jgi:hypothetical protein
MTTGSGAPSAACAVPTSSNLAMYWDSVGLNIYYCSATTPTWQKFSTDGNGQGLSGSIEFMGTTSGGAGFAVSDVAAATQILYMLPTTNGTANQVLYDTGSATCGTYTTGSPALCHQLAWESLGSLAALSTATIATGGTNATSAASAGLVPNTSSTTASAWTATPTLGVAASVTGSTTYANATGSGTFNVSSSPSTTTNTLLGPTAVPVTGHLLDVTVAGTVATLHDSGLATANIDTSTTTKPLAYGGTGVDLSAAGGAVNTTGAQVLHENAAHVISSSAIALVDLPTITVPYGGTGLATLTAHAVQVGEGTSTLAQVGPNAATTYPLFSAGSSADPAFRAIAVGDLPVLHGQCTEAWGGSGTLFAMTSGDDAIVNNTCYNDSGATRTITAVKCRSDNAANSTAITPTFGAAGTGTTILTGAVTCGNSYAYAAGTLDTGSHIAWTTGTGIDPGMTTVGNATSIALLIEYTYQPY